MRQAHHAAKQEKNWRHACGWCKFKLLHALRPLNQSYDCIAAGKLRAGELEDL